ncbi:MAG: hypothetical protein ABSH50_16615 [Bryobacteraceae bacterium]
MATLKVNLSAVGNACDQDPTPAGHFPGPGWYVFLADCHGNPIVRAGKEYGPFPVDHGYVEIPDVPPGRYLVFAIVNPVAVGVPVPGGEILFQSNFVSHFAIVDVCCGCHDYCVKLYNSGWHYCIRVIVYWLTILAAQRQIAPDVGKSAVSALTKALQTGETLPGDAAINDLIGKLVAQFGASQD